MCCFVEEMSTAMYVEFISNAKTDCFLEERSTALLVFFVCFLLLYVPSQQLWSLRDGQFT